MTATVKSKRRCRGLRPRQRLTNNPTARSRVMASEHGMTIEARSATYADAGMGGTAPKTKKPAAV